MRSLYRKEKVREVTLQRCGWGIALVLVVVYGGLGAGAAPDRDVLVSRDSQRQVGAQAVGSTSTYGVASQTIFNGLANASAFEVPFPARTGVSDNTVRVTYLAGAPAPELAGNDGTARASGDSGVSGEGTLNLDLGNHATMELRLMPAGKFMMGSPDREVGHESDESPQREVTITRSFFVGVYEVTQEQFEEVMGSNPSEFKNAAKPVDQVSWDEATEFCRRLSAKTGRNVRLPTEAEWEYACRAGSKGRYCCGDDDRQLVLEYARCGLRGGARAAAVGGKKPNAWGLQEMHGNVSEWCADWYASYAGAQSTDPAGPAQGELRVVRGGCWFFAPRDCRSASRGKLPPDSRFNHVGFRVALDVK